MSKIPNKQCTKCSKYKSSNEFHKDSNKQDKLNSNCKICRKITCDAYYINNKEKHNNAVRNWQNNNKEYYKKMVNNQNKKRTPYKRDWYLQKNYNMSISEYNKILTKQNNKCAICIKKENLGYKDTRGMRKLAVDHCHKTGKIRGLLCFHCNTSLGKFKDNIVLLERAIKYIKGTLKYEGN